MLTKFCGAGPECSAPAEINHAVPRCHAERSEALGRIAALAMSRAFSILPGGSFASAQDDTTPIASRKATRLLPEHERLAERLPFRVVKRDRQRFLRDLEECEPADRADARDRIQRVVAQHQWRDRIGAGAADEIERT